MSSVLCFVVKMQRNSSALSGDATSQWWQQTICRQFLFYVMYSTYNTSKLCLSPEIASIL